MMVAAPMPVKCSRQMARVSTAAPAIWRLRVRARSAASRARIDTPMPRAIETATSSESHSTRPWVWKAARPI